METNCDNMNRMNGKQFWSTYKQLFCNQYQLRLGVLLDQGSLAKEAPNKAKTLSKDFFAEQNLRIGSLNEKLHQDVKNQVNFITMYERKNFERVEHRRRSGQPR